MAGTPDGYKKHKLGLGDINEAAIAGEAYLDAARIYRIRLMRKIKARWLFVPDWYVVHHLSFISVELYLKSFGAMNFHSHYGDGSGPFDEFTVHGYRGHELKDQGIPSSILLELEGTLSVDQYSLLDRLRKREFSKAELSIGRYPYERDKTRQEYPSGEDGRQRAEDWLTLAKSLRNFRLRHSAD